MNNNDKFENIYSQLTDMFAEEFEETRRKVRGDMIWNIVVALSLLALACFALFKIAQIIEDAAMGAFLYFGVVVLLSIVFSRVMRLDFPDKFYNYKKNSKEQVINYMLKYFNPNLTIEASKGFPKDLYEKSHFDKKFTFYRSEDLISGKISNNCNFIMAEVLTQYEATEKDFNHTVFNGLVTKIDLHKSFELPLFVRNQTQQYSHLRYIPKLPERVLLDSSEFEKLFNVYCDNELLAMQILTPDLQLILSDFYKNTKIKLDFTLKNDSLFIRFWTGGKMFELPSVFSFSLDKELLQYYYTVIEFTLNVSTTFTKILNDMEHI